MKMRLGYVSNSSSSSFVCDFCGEKSYSRSGEIEGCEDIAMSFCPSCCETYAHIFCADHLPEDGICPICSMKVVGLYDGDAYLLKTTSYTKEDAFAAIKMVNKRRKKLYDGDYMNYVLKEQGRSTEELLEEIKSKFEGYAKFIEFLRQKTL